MSHNCLGVQLGTLISDTYVNMIAGIASIALAGARVCGKAGIPRGLLETLSPLGQDLCHGVQAASSPWLQWWERCWVPHPAWASQSPSVRG